MTRRGFALAAALITAGVCALSLGNLLYLYFALLLLTVLGYALLSVLWCFLTVSCRQQLSMHKVSRGESAELLLSVRHACPLPVGAFRIFWDDPGQAGDYAFSAPPFQTVSCRLPLSARHVGSYAVQAKRLEISDVFGLFTFKKHPQPLPENFLVLPKPFAIDKPRVSPGDDGSAALARTQEDYNAPEDVRAYQPGDAMKRVHWKLSSRKRELLVRRFETPAPPDTLILLDCAEPLGGDGAAEGKLNLRDALCETAVAVAKMQMVDGSPVRLPLYGQMANEFTSDNASGLSILQEMLAMQPFFAGEDFARVLQLELRRMRRTGAAVIITTRLDARIVEGVSHIRRMGPTARLYLVTYTPDDPSLQPFVTRLQHHLVEVCYVTPA